MEQIADPLEPAAEIVRRCEQKQLMALYKVGAYSGAEDLLRQIAMARGKLKAGGVPVLEVHSLIWPAKCSGMLPCTCSVSSKSGCFAQAHRVIGLEAPPRPSQQ